MKPYFDILQAVNGTEGIKMATEHSPDLIISDIMMPEINGLDLCKKVKANINTSHIPIILLTALTSDEQQI